MNRIEDYLARIDTGRFEIPAPRTKPLMRSSDQWSAAGLLALLVGLVMMIISSLGLPGQHAAGIDVIPNGWQPFNVDADGRPAPNAHACGSISWGIIPSGAPYSGFEADAVRAATKITAASGIPLEYEGHFSLDEFDKVDVLIGWADDPEFPSGAVGLASMGGDGGGLIWLRKTSDNGPGFDGGWGSVLLHEWGHIIGLDHVEDPTSVMNEIGLGERLNRGDRRGLWALGRGSCT